MGVPSLGHTFTAGATSVWQEGQRGIEPGTIATRSGEAKVSPGWKAEAAGRLNAAPRSCLEKPTVDRGPRTVDREENADGSRARPQPARYRTVDGPPSTVNGRSSQEAPRRRM